MSTPAPISRSGAQEEAHRELARAIYHRHDDPLAVRLLKAAGRRLDNVLNLSAAHAPGGGLGLAGLIIVVGTLVAVVFWRTGPMRRSAASPGALLDTGSRQHAADHRAAARLAEARRDWRNAVIEGMRAVARELEERGILEPRPGRTAVEVAADARRELPELAEWLHDAAHTFDAVVYGGRAPTVDDAAAVRRADDAVTGSASRVRRERATV